jgi:hypothetical protein
MCTNLDWRTFNSKSRVSLFADLTKARSGHVGFVAGSGHCSWSSPSKIPMPTCVLIPQAVPYSI